MSYTLELGYPKLISVHHPTGYVSMYGFETASVKPFTGGSYIPADPESGMINEALGITPYEYGDDVLTEIHPMDIPRAVDNDGLVEAEVGITINYSEKIMAVTGIHLSWLHGQKAAESTTPFLQLISELSEDGYGDYWSPTDGNIRHLAATLLDWTFQHPDAYFFSVS